VSFSGVANPAISKEVKGFKITLFDKQGGQIDESDPDSFYLQTTPALL